MKTLHLLKWNCHMFLSLPTGVKIFKWKGFTHCSGLYRISICNACQLSSEKKKKKKKRVLVNIFKCQTFNLLKSYRYTQSFWNSWPTNLWNTVVLCIVFDVQKTSVCLRSHNSDLNQGRKVCKTIYYFYKIKQWEIGLPSDNTKYWNYS